MEMCPGEGRKNLVGFVGGIFVSCNEIWRKQGIRHIHCSRIDKQAPIFVLPNFENVYDSSPLDHSNIEDVFD